MFDRQIEKVLENHEKRIKELEKKHEFIVSEGKKIEEAIKNTAKIEKEEQTKENKRVRVPYTRSPPIEKGVQNGNNKS